MNLLKENRKKIKRNLQKKAYYMARLVILFIFVFGTFAHVIPNTIHAAPPSTGTSNGTYDFSDGFGEAVGPGFIKQGDKFVVSDIVQLYDTAYGKAIYNPSQVPYAEETIIIKAENGSVCKTFTFKDLGLSSSVGAVYLEIKVVLKNISGGEIATLSNYGNPFETTYLNIFKLSEILGNGSEYNYKNVASVNITFKFSKVRNSAADDYSYWPENLNIENITIADVSNTVNTAPTATNVEVDGTLEVGSVLTGNYDYDDEDDDEEGTSTYKWYRSDDGSGTGKTAISGATDKTYTLTSADKGKYISFEVTPIASGGDTTGTPEESPKVGPIVNPNIAPTATNVEVDGIHEVGSVLTGKYTYYDEHDPEGTSTFKWYRSNDASGTGKAAIVDAENKTYTLTSDDTNKFISFEVTPIASAGVNPGSSVESPKVGPIIQPNRAPVLNNTNPSLPATDEDTETSEIVVSSFLDSSDQDSGALKGIAVTGVTGNGKWQYFDTTWKDISSVSDSSALLLKDTDKIKYIPDSKNGETATLTFRAWDQTYGSVYSKVNATTNGGSTAFSTAVGTASLTVNDVNDAPKLISGPYTFTPVTKNATSAEVTVASIATMSDVDNGAASGIAIYHATGNGTWEYSLDGTTWQAFGTVSDSSSLLLRATDKVRYKSSNLGETASFSFRGWDQTSGTQGTKVDTTTNGGTTAFSDNTQTASIEVTKSNEANILSFSIPGELKPATIDDGTIVVSVAGGQNVSSLVPTFTVSDNAQFVKVGTIDQVSGTTANDFSSPVTYVVTAEDGTTKNWIVTVTQAPSDISLTNNTVGEKLPAGTEVGILSGAAQAGDTLTYSIQSGDNAAFEIDNNRLITKTALDYNTNKQYILTIRVTNQHGAYFDKDFTIDVLDKTPPTANVTMISNNGQDTSKAKVGDTIMLDIVANEDIAAPTVKIAGNNAAVTQKADAKTWQATYIMQTDDTEGLIPFTLDFKDVNNNQAAQVTAVTTGTAVVFDKTAPTASTVTIHSNNADQTIAKIGDTITLDIITDEDIQQPTVTIVGKPTAISDKGDSDAKTWQANYTVQSSDSGGPVSFTIDIADLAGNKTTTITSPTDGSSVTVLSSNADLANIITSKGSLTPNFARNEISYTMSVGNEIEAIDITPTVADPLASVQVNGTQVTSGVPVNIPLAMGQNTVTIEVIAQDLTPKTYTIAITRMLSNDANLSNLVLSQGTLNPTFDPNVTNYSVNVDTDVSELTISATPKQPSASVTMNGKTTNTDTISLSFGPNEVPIVVTAQDGQTTMTYNVTINRLKSGNANLGSLAVDKGTLTPAFSPSVAAYQVNVDYNTPQIAVTAQAADQGSSLTMNGKTVSPTMGTQSITTPDSIAIVTTGDTIKVSMTETFNLKVGANPIPVIVTAQDGGTKIYTVTVIRQSAPSSDDDNGSGNGGGSGGGGSSSGSGKTTNEPTNGQTRTVNVNLGNGNSIIAEVEVTRTTTADGKQRDTIVFDPKKAESVVESVLQKSQSHVRIVIDDLPDNPADEVAVTVPKESLNELVNGKLSLEIQTGDVKVTIPQEALTAFNQLGIDLYFNIVPIRDEKEKKNVGERTVNAAEVRKVAGNSQVQVHGKPMTIETNLKNHPTKVVFPLKRLQLPSDPKERKALLDSLAIYIEHSDGEKKVQQGTVIYDAQGNPEGLEIEITKFSTFTIISIEQEDESVLESNLKDIKGHWAEKAIRQLVSKGAVNGYPDGTFKPNQTVTRAEFVAMVVKALNVKEAGDVQTFTDLQNHWSKHVIEQAAANGIVNGLSKERFGPNEQITREQMAAMIINAGKLGIVDSKSNFQDYSEIASWAESSVNTAAYHKIVNGLPNQTFNPKGKATRAEAATVIMNVVDFNY
ncbi:MAG TPA: hypothetical protein GX497_14305 [Bacillus bacterium]|nr:hypothetical protein [Bacillus sp. (in: firmicutes)]